MRGGDQRRFIDWQGSFHMPSNNLLLDSPDGQDQYNIEC